MSGSAQEINDSLAQLSAHRTRLQRRASSSASIRPRRHGDGVGVRPGGGGWNPRFELRVYPQLNSQQPACQPLSYSSSPSHVQPDLELNPDSRARPDSKLAGSAAAGLTLGQFEKPVRLPDAASLLAPSQSIQSGSLLTDRSQAFAQHLAALS
uniref:Uncharacterized protein n=1 Tax=Macrostomum lignano TaxID=282301 RepID=A0A1I8FLB5_9PLAT